MGFKVGDKVRISYNWKANANNTMLDDRIERDQLAGMVMTIEAIHPGLNGDVYFGDFCSDPKWNGYGWFGDQLELVEEENGMIPIIKDCKYFDGVERCLGTRELDPCSSSYCPCNNEKKQTESLVKGVEPDAPVVVNEKGGKQSDSPYAFHMIPTSAMFAAAEVCAYGANKYGETIDNRNYTKIPTEEHINHAVAHLLAHLAGDRQDSHLSHAIVRCMFAYDCAMRGEAV